MSSAEINDPDNIPKFSSLLKKPGFFEKISGGNLEYDKSKQKIIYDRIRSVLVVSKETQRIINENSFVKLTISNDKNNYSHIQFDQVVSFTPQCFNSYRDIINYAKNIEDVIHNESANSFDILLTVNELNTHFVNCYNMLRVINNGSVDAQVHQSGHRGSALIEVSHNTSKESQYLDIPYELFLQVSSYVRAANNGIGRLANTPLDKYGMRLHPSTCNEARSEFSFPLASVPKALAVLEKYIVENMKKNKIPTRGNNFNASFERHIYKLSNASEEAKNEFLLELENLPFKQMPLHFLNYEKLTPEQLYEEEYENDARPDMKSILDFIEKFNAQKKAKDACKRVEEFARTVLSLYVQLKQIYVERGFDSVLVEEANGNVTCRKMVVQRPSGCELGGEEENVGIAEPSLIEEYASRPVITLVTLILFVVILNGIALLMGRK